MQRALKAPPSTYMCTITKNPSLYVFTQVKINDIVSVKSTEKSGTYKEGKPHNFDYYRVVEKSMKGHELSTTIKDAKRTNIMTKVRTVHLARTKSVHHNSDLIPHVPQLLVGIADFKASLYTWCSSD